MKVTVLEWILNVDEWLLPFWGWISAPGVYSDCDTNQLTAPLSYLEIIFSCDSPFKRPNSYLKTMMVLLLKFLQLIAYQLLTPSSVLSINWGSSFNNIKNYLNVVAPTALMIHAFISELPLPDFKWGINTFTYAFYIVIVFTRIFRK